MSVQLCVHILYPKNSPEDEDLATEIAAAISGIHTVTRHAVPTASDMEAWNDYRGILELFRDANKHDIFVMVGDTSTNDFLVLIGFAWSRTIPVLHLTNTRPVFFIQSVLGDKSYAGRHPHGLHGFVGLLHPVQLGDWVSHEVLKMLTTYILITFPEH